jgi:integrase
MPEKRITVWVQHFADREYLMLQWYDPDTGKRKSRSAQTNNPVDAEKKRADLEYELNNGLYKEPSKLGWEKFREMFEDEYVAGLRETSREKYTAVFDVFEQIVNPGKLHTINERVLSQFLKGMRERKQKNGKVGLEPWTIKNYLVALKKALGWAVEQKLLPHMPHFPVIKVPKKKPQPIPEEDWLKLYQAAPTPLWKAYLLCGWFGGLRLSEAWQLRRNVSEDAPWLDLPGNRIILPAGFAKSDEDQWIPLHPDLRAALKALPDTGDEVFPFRNKKTGEPLTRAGLSQHVRNLAKRAGVKLSMHRLRKGFGCRVAAQLGKGNAPVLHRLMRHSSMQITMEFYASVDDVLQDTIRDLK